jgi:hypothetical protein
MESSSYIEVILCTLCALQRQFNIFLLLSTESQVYYILCIANKSLRETFHAMILHKQHSVSFVRHTAVVEEINDSSVTDEH